LLANASPVVMSIHIQEAALPGLTPAAIADERRRGRLAGAGGIGALGCAITAIVISGRATRNVAGSGVLSRQLRSLGSDLAVHELAVAARLLGLVLTACFGLFLTRAIRDRATHAPGAMRVLAIVAPACVGVGLVAGLVGLHDIATEIPVGTRISEDLAQSLVEHDAVMRVVAVWDMAAHLVFGIWLSLLCIWAMRVGLLSRFLAVWGIGTGISGVLLPVGDALFLSWLGSAAILTLGVSREGRSPAWETGRAVPWTEVDAERAAARRPADTS
jgi:hypothetical protein